MKTHFHKTVTFKVEIETDPIPQGEADENGSNDITWAAYFLLNQESWVYDVVMGWLKAGNGELDRSQVAYLVEKAFCGGFPIGGDERRFAEPLARELLVSEQTIYVDEICKEWESDWGAHLKG